MLIVCPSCASEYMIDPGRLGAEGRNVRCAKCKETWFVAPEPAEPEPAEPETDTAIDGSPDPASMEEAAPPQEGVDAQEQFSSARSETPQENEYPASRAEDRLRAAARAAAHTSGGPRRRFAATGPLLCLAAVILAGSAYWGRTHVVRAFPAAAALYAGVGLPINLRGLEFRAVRSELLADGGDTFLVVEGEVANISGRDAPVPPIEIGLRGAEGQMLYTWTNTPPRPTLTASDTAPFRARLAAPPAEARQVLVRFAAGQDGAAVASHAP
jgi:predicted Zn finger-like uncharacterized protein